MKIAIAGASGFIGRSLVEVLKTHHELVGLSRSAHTSSEKDLDWRCCDLFSLLDAEQGLEGVDVAIYLVHSMRPSARLTQGSFRDFDLIVADNFVRAAEKAHVKHIIYLGGLYPQNVQKVSSHLESRHEVEDLFKASKVPYTILRAPLILGAEGSSFHIMTRLVERLPVMFCPQWTKSRSQPVAVQDVVKIIRYSVESTDARNRTFDLGGPEALSYVDLMKKVAEQKGLKRRLIPVPFLTPRLSALWVCLITGAPYALVRPLVDGLKTDLLIDAHKEVPHEVLPTTSVEEALKIAFAQYDDHKNPAAFNKVDQGTSEVRSVQRLEVPKGVTAEEVAKAYMRFLPLSGLGLLKVSVDDPVIRFSLRFPAKDLLVLNYSKERSWPHRQLFYVRGGLLAQETKRGRLEFREVLGGTAIIAAIHEFKPRLPWYLYRWSQAFVHVYVMKQFGWYLRRKRFSR